ncbi:hypothetical protein Ancab_015786 [Ancistrocladus abbreviatus]
MEKPDLGDRVDSEDRKASELGSSGEKRCPKLKLFGVEINCSGEAAESGNATTAFNLIREEQMRNPCPVQSLFRSLSLSPLLRCSLGLLLLPLSKHKKKKRTDYAKACEFFQMSKDPTTKATVLLLGPKSATVTPMSGSSKAQERSFKVNKRLPIKKRDCSSSGIRGGVAAPTSGLSAALRDKIRQLGDDDPKLVIEKKLTACDVNSSQARLTMPGNKTSAFLTVDEREVINSKDEKGNPKGIDTTVIDPSLQTRDIKLRKWCYSSSASYVLVSGWNNVVRHNRLKTGDTVQKDLEHKRPYVDVILNGCHLVLDFPRMVKLDMKSGSEQPITWIDEGGSCFFSEFCSEDDEQHECGQQAVHKDDSSWTLGIHGPQEIKLQIDIDLNGLNGSKLTEYCLISVSN